MNRTDARRIAETITNQQLKEMFDSAKENIKDWTTTSSVNKGFTKGLAWNILTAAFDVNEEQHILSKTNMIREFGEFLPNSLKVKEKTKEISPMSSIQRDARYQISATVMESWRR